MPPASDRQHLPPVSDKGPAPWPPGHPTSRLSFGQLGLKAMIFFYTNHFLRLPRQPTFSIPFATAWSNLEATHCRGRSWEVEGVETWE